MQTFNIESMRAHYVLVAHGAMVCLYICNIIDKVGKIYSRLTFHVCKTSDYLEFLSSYCSDSDPDFDNKIDKVRDELNTKYIRAKPDVLLRAILQYCAAMLQY